MTKLEKANIIDEIREILINNNVVYIADLSGMNASQTSDFRRQAFKNNIKVKVVKNKLLLKAMQAVEEKNYNELFDTLKGNTAILLSDTGNAPAKMIKDFRKKADKPQIKSAWIDEAVYIGDNVDELANMKSKDELLGELIGLLQSPIKNVISQLQSGANTITGVLKTLENK